MILKTGNKGFTLIEVLVASVILFAGLGAVLKAYSLAVVAMESAGDKLSVCQVIQAKVGELDLQVFEFGEALPSGAGRQKMGGYEYLWRIQSTRQDLTPQVSVLRVAIEVDRAYRAQGNVCLYERTQFRKKN